MFLEFVILVVAIGVGYYLGRTKTDHRAYYDGFEEGRSQMLIYMFDDMKGKIDTGDRRHTLQVADEVLVVKVEETYFVPPDPEEVLASGG